MEIYRLLCSVTMGYADADADTVVANKSSPNIQPIKVKKTGKQIEIVKGSGELWTIVGPLDTTDRGKRQ